MAENLRRPNRIMWGISKSLATMRYEAAADVLRAAATCQRSAMNMPTNAAPMKPPLRQRSQFRRDGPRRDDRDDDRYREPLNGECDGAESAPHRGEVVDVGQPEQHRQQRSGRRRCTPPAAPTWPSSRCPAAPCRGRSTPARRSRRRRTGACPPPRATARRVRSSATASAADRRSTARTRELGAPVQQEPAAQHPVERARRTRRVQDRGDDHRAAAQEHGHVAWHHDGSRVRWRARTAASTRRRRGRTRSGRTSIGEEVVVHRRRPPRLRRRNRVGPACTGPR